MAQAGMRPRFDRLWDEWDEAVEGGHAPVDLIRELVDESILELLAGGGRERQYEHDILMTELQNRLARARRELEVATEAVVVVNERIRVHMAAAAGLALDSLTADEILMRHRDAVRSRTRHAEEAGARVEQSRGAGPTRG